MKTEASLKDVPLDAQTAECLWGWKLRSPYPAERLGVCVSTYKRQATVLAWNTVAVLREASTDASWYYQARLVSHFPAYVWDSLECKWRESEGCAGVAAARKPQGHHRRLHASSGASEARGTNQFGQTCKERVRFGSQVRLSGSNWIMKKNSELAEVLYFVGVPDGI